MSTVLAEPLLLLPLNIWFLVISCCFLNLPWLYFLRPTTCACRGTRRHPRSSWRSRRPAPYKLLFVVKSCGSLIRVFWKDTLFQKARKRSQFKKNGVRSENPSKTYRHRTFFNIYWIKVIIMLIYLIYFDFLRQ